MKKVFQAVLVLILFGIGAAAAQAQYLALGDSIPFGYDPTVWNPYAIPPTSPPADLLNHYHGYPQLVSAFLKLPLANAACPGQTSGSFIKVDAPDNGCNDWRSEVPLAMPLFVTYSSLSQSQLDYAVAFLLKNPKTSLVTITIGGDDLLLLENNCAAKRATPAGIESCELAGLGDVLVTFAKNLTAIYLAIRVEARYAGPIVAVNYYSPDYANALVTTSVSALDGVLRGLTTTFGGKVADVFSAFQQASAASGGLPCAIAPTPLAFPNPSVPGGCDVHPTAAGQLLIANLVEALK